VMLVKAVQGVNSMIMTRAVVIGADGFPLDSYTGGGAEAVIALFALLGMYVLIIPLQSLIVLIRYRSMIPFMYLLFIAVQIGARVLNQINHVDKPAGPPIGFTINLIIFALTLIGFALSLQDRSPKLATQAA
jgi:predicted tellurium resistance membrane protein TerC